MPRRNTGRTRVVVSTDAGCLVGLFGGMALVSMLSSNTHDRSMELVTTGFFAIGPLRAVIGFVGTLIFRLVRSER